MMAQGEFILLLSPSWHEVELACDKVHFGTSKEVCLARESPFWHETPVGNGS